MRSPTKRELFEEAMSQKSTEKRQLWVVIAKEWTAKGWELVFRYNHADTDYDARLTYINARLGTDQAFQILATGPAVGYHVHDNNGDVLSA